MCVNGQRQNMELHREKNIMKDKELEQKKRTQASFVDKYKNIFHSFIHSFIQWWRDQISNHHLTNKLKIYSRGSNIKKKRPLKNATNIKQKKYEKSI